MKPRFTTVSYDISYETLDRFLITLYRFKAVPQETAYMRLIGHTVRQFNSWNYE